MAITTGCGAERNETWRLLGYPNGCRVDDETGSYACGELVPEPSACLLGSGSFVAEPTGEPASYVLRFVGTPDGLEVNESADCGSVRSVHSAQPIDLDEVTLRFADDAPDRLVEPDEWSAPTAP